MSVGKLFVAIFQFQSVQSRYENVPLVEYHVELIYLGQSF